MTFLIIAAAVIYFLSKSSSSTAAPTTSTGAPAPAGGAATTSIDSLVAAGGSLLTGGPTLNPSPIGINVQTFADGAPGSIGTQYGVSGNAAVAPINPPQAQVGQVLHFGVFTLTIQALPNPIDPYSQNDPMTSTEGVEIPAGTVVRSQGLLYGGSQSYDATVEVTGPATFTAYSAGLGQLLANL